MGFDWSPMAAAGVRTAGDLLGVALSDSGPSLGQQYRKALRHQKKLMRKGPSWAAEGARRAGLHPLAAIGMAPTGGPSVSAGPNNAKAKMAQRMGQNIGRALDKQLTALQKEQARANIELTRAQTKAMQSQIPGQFDPSAEHKKHAGESAGMPSKANQLVRTVPSEQEARDPRNPSFVAAKNASDAWYRHGNFVSRFPSEKFKESIEDQLFPQAKAAILNAIRAGKEMIFWQDQHHYAMRNYPYNENPGKGLQWQYLPGTGTFRRVPYGYPTVLWGKVPRYGHKTKKVFNRLPRTGR